MSPEIDVIQCGNYWVVASRNDVEYSHLDVRPISLEVDTKGYGTVKTILPDTSYVSLVTLIQQRYHQLTSTK